ncbi:TetR/AcrR family transcriptional regulator [Streptomyces sp. NPDC001691]|uniref:TetR/AcrR family transcriptional regulator n=1 Tax=Streptomyces sp. NPDC001691 TaxID=3364600 RepID=UPI0036AFD848
MTGSEHAQQHRPDSGPEHEQMDEDRLLPDVARALQELHPNASMAQIARQVQVAPATMYLRHPTKDSLLQALATWFFDGLITLLDRALEEPPDRQLERFLRTAGVHLATSRSVLPHAFGEMARPEQRQLIYAKIAELLVTAKKAHAVHPDVALADIGAVVWSMRGVIETTAGLAPDAWQRHLDIVLAGLTNTRATFAHPPLSDAVLDEAIRRSGTDTRHP